MIQKIKYKIKSESGVSFLFAMITFMVAAMVSVTIVTAASTAMKRVYDDRKWQQDMLALTSAAQLIRDEMYKTKYVITTTTWLEKGTNPGKQEISYDTEGVFGSEMKTAVESLKSGSSYTSTSKAIVLEVKEDSSIDFEMPKVNVSFTMNKENTEYIVTFTISTEQSDNAVFLTMYGVENIEPSSESEDKIVNVTKISWGNPLISSWEEDK